MENIEMYLQHLHGYDYTGKMPVVIDFYATWCGPCKVLSPQIERLAKEYENRVKVLKVDVEKNTPLALAACIRSVPTLFFITKEGVIERHVGGLSYEELSSRVERMLRR